MAIQLAIQQEVGDKGEHIAVDYLLKSGYIVLEKNYRAKKSEIDIIYKEGSTTVFVEVKTRSSVGFGHPETFVDKAKSAKITEGAESYVIETEWDGAIRFDIISILIKNDKIEIKHFKDAFY